MGKQWKQWQTLFWGASKITADGDCNHEIKDACSLEDKLWPRQHIKTQRHYFANKGPSSQSYGFSSSHVWMWELDYKESWTLKTWCFWTVALEKTLESPLDCKCIKPVNSKGNQSKGNQSWIFIGSTDAEAKIPILWPPDVKNWLIGKDPDAGKDWRHHWLELHEFGQAVAVGDGQGRLVCCSPWGRKKSDTTEQLSWTVLKDIRIPTTKIIILITYSMLCCSLLLLCSSHFLSPLSQWWLQLPGSSRSL